MSDLYDFIDDQRNTLMLKNGENHFTKPRERSISQDLLKYDLPEDIISTADFLYKKDNVSICRQRKRLHLLFFYTLEAYRKRQGNVNTNNIAEIFNLDQGEIKTAISKFNKMKKKSKVSFSSPVEYVVMFARQLNVKEDLINDLVILSKKVITKKPILLNSFPETLASGILHYYFSTLNYNFERELFEKTVSRSSATIRKMSKIICEIDNRED